MMKPKVLVDVTCKETTKPRCMLPVGHAGQHWNAVEGYWPRRRKRDGKKTAVVAALLEVEWEEHGGGTFTCRGCSTWTFNPLHHDKDCRVDEALRLLGFATARDRVDEKRRLGIHAPEALSLLREEQGIDR